MPLNEKDFRLLDREAKFLETMRLINEKGLTTYQLNKGTGLSTSIFFKMEQAYKDLEKNVYRPTDKTLIVIYDYVRSYIEAPTKVNSVEFAKLITNNFAKKIIDSDLNLVPLVYYHEQAYYIKNWFDENYVNGLPVFPILSDKTFKGQFRCFEMEGDSMDVAGDLSIRHKDILFTRELRKELWVDYLTQGSHYFVIVSSNGIYIRSITEYDKYKKQITCHPLNPLYEDVILDIKEIKEIFTILKIVDRDLKLR